MIKVTTKNPSKIATSEIQQLLEDRQYWSLPKVGDVVSGIVSSITKTEVHLDLGGYSGVIRGRELYNESEDYAKLGLGDPAEATVLDLENELGEVELSFRFAGQQRSWGKLEDLRDAGELVTVTVREANKGGLIVDVNNVEGFLPVSQLSAEHYPRVPGGDKVRILEKLKEFIGEKFVVKVLDASLDDGKLIVSEKKVEEDKQVEKINAHRVGEVCEGPITAIADFGAFMEFAPGLTGLIHISELAWQRVENPSEIVVMDQKVKAQIININGPKVFLSVKRLLPDPWKTVQEKYAIGTRVKGKIRKINSFGLFVELDPEIHGLAHVSELGMAPEEVAEKVKLGDEMEFTIVSLKPLEYRLGLSLTKTAADVAASAKEEPVTEDDNTKKESAV
ncbi:MAG: S1 RNA-binding domain-containing protein [Patescibacteria group bacterium]|jgi:small subunit ribosomal protein S1